MYVNPLALSDCCACAHCLSSPDRLRAAVEKNMESGSVLKGLFYGGFASCVAETGARTPHAGAAASLRLSIAQFACLWQSRCPSTL